MRSTSLHRRFLTAVLLSAAAMLVVVTVVVYAIAKSHYLRTSEASARAIVMAVQQTLAVGVYARDNVLLKELVDGLVHHPSVAQVRVRDLAGNTLASSVSGQLGAREAQDTAASESTFASPLRSPFNSLEEVGRFEVWLDTSRLAADAGNQAALVVAALCVLVAGVLIVFNALASRLLSRPMHRLAGELALIDPGSPRRLPIAPQHAADEVGIVTAAANRLLDLQQAALERERSVREEISALEARYRGIFVSTNAGIFILSPQGDLVQANPALSTLLGLPADVAETGLADFARKVCVDPDLLAQLIERARQTGQPESADLELRRLDGTHLWIHCMVSASEKTAGTGRTEGVLYDITHRKAQEHAAQHRAEHDALTGLKNRAYIESALDHQVSAAQQEDGSVTLMFIDLDGFKAVNDRWGHAAGDAVLVEAAGRLLALFQRGCELVGRLGGDELVVMIVGTEANHSSVSEQASRLLSSFRDEFLLPNGERARVGASVGIASYPLHATSAETLIHAADAAMYAVKQAGKGGFAIAATGADMSGKAPGNWQEALNSLASTANLQRDPLTGLIDRRQLMDRLAMEHERVSRGGGLTGVVCLDIDQFKLINVAHGAPIGDEVLCEVAHRLGGMLRSADLLARTGGDEFVVLVATDSTVIETARRTAEGVANKLLDRLAGPLNLSLGPLTVHLRAGVSVIDVGTGSGVDALREAQLALRKAKSQRTTRTPVLFKQDMLAEFHDRISLETDLRSAIGTDQIQLHLQPQVDGSGRVVGAEALLRWRHPTRGSVPPDQFIPLAEASGLIFELGAWVLEEGCAMLQRLRAVDNELRLAINISPIQFSHPEFVGRVKQALASSRAPAEGLIMEITESVLISDIQNVTERLHELVQLGVRFSIDDFGTGFSSLAYLRQLPLHEIKIDRSFIAGLPEDVANVGIVRSILAVGSHLGLLVIAEGVETQEQADFLQAQGCRLQQGWLHGRPGSEAQFIETITAGAA